VDKTISELNTSPACAPVNASPASLRLPTHDSGSGWIATPFLCGSYIRDSRPVYPGARGFVFQKALSFQFLSAQRSPDLFARRSRLPRSVLVMGRAAFLPKSLKKATNSLQVTDSMVDRSFGFVSAIFQPND
jgi:hypothetical protein